MARKSKSPLAPAFDMARLCGEAWTVVGLRLTKLAAGGPLAVAEAHRMVAEKAVAAVEAQFAVGAALMGGATHEMAHAKAFAIYRKRVRANRRRLMAP